MKDYLRLGNRYLVRPCVLYMALHVLAGLRRVVESVTASSLVEAVFGKGVVLRLLQNRRLRIFFPLCLTSSFS